MYKFLTHIKNAEKRISTNGLDRFEDDYKLKSPKELDYSENEIMQINRNVTEEHYEHMKNKLLSLERHPINNSKIAKWVDEQPNESFKIAATKFANSIIYTDYNAVINNVEHIAEQIIDDYETSVIILGNQKQKSSYYFSILIATYIYSKYGKLPLSFSKNFMSAFQRFEFGAVYIDIDDMTYTGSQTFDLLLRYTNGLKWSFQVEEKTTLDKTVNLLLNHMYLKLKDLRYKLVRLYMSTYSMGEAIRNKPILLPFEIITNKELIPTFKESIIEDSTEDSTEDSIIDYLIITIFFNLNYPSITCSYFDYKIADLASTTAFPLLSGYIPSSDFIEYFLSYEHINDVIYEELRLVEYNNKTALIEEFKRRIKPDNNSDCKFINFVENCFPKRDFIEELMNDEIEYHKNNGIFQESKNLENSLINDCPKPFYKQSRLFGIRKRRTSKKRKTKITKIIKKKRKSKNIKMRV